MPTHVDMLMRGLGDLGGTIKTMTKARQKQAIHDLFERVDFNTEGEICAVYPAAWAQSAFSCLKEAYQDLGANDALNGHSKQDKHISGQWLLSLIIIQNLGTKHNFTQ